MDTFCEIIYIDCIVMIVSFNLYPLILVSHGDLACPHFKAVGGSTKVKLNVVVCSVRFPPIDFRVGDSAKLVC